MRIEVDRTEFADIIIAFLYQKLVKGDKLIPENERFTEIMKIIDGKGLKAYFMKYYLTLDGTTKIRFKRFIKPLKDGGKSVIEIQKPDEKELEKETKKKKKGIVRKIFNKIIGNEAISRKELAFLYEEIYIEEDVK
jgi:hypothetical protein